LAESSNPLTISDFDSSVLNVLWSKNLNPVSVFFGVVTSSVVSASTDCFFNENHD
jgi:hypothetical protein